MRAVALLLVVTACFPGRIVVNVDDIARSAGAVHQSGRAKVEATDNSNQSVRVTTTTIRRDQRVSLNLSGHLVGENERFTGFKRPTIAELLIDCPRDAFVPDASTRQTHPRCMLLAVDDGRVQVGTTRGTGRFLLGVLAIAAGGGASIGIGACVAYCDQPYSSFATGAMIVGGVVAVGAIILVGALLSGDR